nr:Retrovirus-related Pol polyprotein from transposon TNT 1-94 [Ipomoea batatas]
MQSMSEKSGEDKVGTYDFRDLTRDGTIDLFYCKCEDQLADIMTKPLKTSAFQKIKEAAGKPPHIGNWFSSYVHESPVLSSIDDLECEPGEEKTSEEEKQVKSRAFGIEIYFPSGENATPNEDKCAIEVVKLVFCIFCPTLLNSLKWKRN